MAQFLPAFTITMGHEGGYSNNPADKGGETYRGIARNYHHTWEGWKIIDGFKTIPNFPKNINAETMNPFVQSFYKKEFWDKLCLDNFCQDISNEMFDTGVNCGTGTAAMFLQKSLNRLNCNATLYKDIVADGGIGNNTINAYNAYYSSYLKKGYSESICTKVLLKCLNAEQVNHYGNIVDKNTTQELFFFGWVNNRG